MSYSNKDFLIAKQFEMKEKESLKWGMICYLINYSFYSQHDLKKIKFSVFDTSS
jgi:hypothetical protein